ncbi:hypothetical protein LZ554_009217 [Drepanopeziza brunnea f. sp. 'monogermtubi']|nr:hypothetical protein LZ554_009217 [Drepanopeziza brunnea f. sp. 'monogermtubi']
MERIRLFLVSYTPTPQPAQIINHRYPFRLIRGNPPLGIAPANWALAYNRPGHGDGSGSGSGSRRDNRYSGPSGHNLTEAAAAAAAAAQARGSQAKAQARAAPAPAPANPSPTRPSQLKENTLVFSPWR